MKLSFCKYQGTGNDFILIDNREGGLEDRLTKEQIAHLCDRRFGIGADGLMLLSREEEGDFRMIYYNSDGGESTMCGNGGRCLVAFAHRAGIKKNRYRFRAVDGIHDAILDANQVSLTMMRPKGYRKLAEDTYWIDTGSPHYVLFSETSVSDLDVYEQGKKLRYSKEFESIGGTNVNFVNQLGDRYLRVRTYERGVEDETLSCGTGVTACAYVKLLLADQVNGSEVILETAGGQLSVSVEEFGKENEVVWLKGPAEFVFEGKVEV